MSRSCAAQRLLDRRREAAHGRVEDRARRPSRRPRGRPRGRDREQQPRPSRRPRARRGRSDLRGPVRDDDGAGAVAEQRRRCGCCRGGSKRDMRSAADHQHALARDAMSTSAAARSRPGEPAHAARTDIEGRRVRRAELHGQRRCLAGQPAVGAHRRDDDGVELRPASQPASRSAARAASPRGFTSRSGRLGAGARRCRCAAESTNPATGSPRSSLRSSVAGNATPSPADGRRHRRRCGTRAVGVSAKEGQPQRLRPQLGSDAPDEAREDLAGRDLRVAARSRWRDVLDRLAPANRPDQRLRELLAHVFERRRSRAGPDGRRAGRTCDVASAARSGSTAEASSGECIADGTGSTTA